MACQDTVLRALVTVCAILGVSVGAVLLPAASAFAQDGESGRRVELAQRRTVLEANIAEARAREGEIKARMAANDAEIEALASTVAGKQKRGEDLSDVHTKMRELFAQAKADAVELQKVILLLSGLEKEQQQIVGELRGLPTGEAK